MSTRKPPAPASNAEATANANAEDAAADLDANPAASALDAEATVPAEREPELTAPTIEDESAHDAAVASWQRNNPQADPEASHG